MKFVQKKFSIAFDENWLKINPNESEVFNPTQSEVGRFRIESNRKMYSDRFGFLGL